MNNVMNSVVVVVVVHYTYHDTTTHQPIQNSFNHQNSLSSSLFLPLFTPSFLFYIFTIFTSQSHLQTVGYISTHCLDAPPFQDYSFTSSHHTFRKGHPLSLSHFIAQLKRNNILSSHLRARIYFFSQLNPFSFLSVLRFTLLHPISRGLLFLSFRNNIVCLRFSMLVLFPHHPLSFFLFLFYFL